MARYIVRHQQTQWHWGRPPAEAQDPWAWSACRGGGGERAVRCRGSGGRRRLCAPADPLGLVVLDRRGLVCDRVLERCPIRTLLPDCTPTATPGYDDASTAVDTMIGHGIPMLLQISGRPSCGQTTDHSPPPPIPILRQPMLSLPLMLVGSSPSGSSLGKLLRQTVVTTLPAGQPGTPPRDNAVSAELMACMLLAP